MTLPNAGSMLPSFYFDENSMESGATLMVRSPRTLYNEFLSNATMGTHDVGSVPRLDLHDALYSSTAALLRRTRADVEEFVRELGTIDPIMDLPTSEEVKRTTVRMFADPKNAEALADAEWADRRKQFLVQRELMAEKINEQLRREREALTKELPQLPKG